MGFLSEYDAVERLTFGKKWWVEVAKYISAADAAAADRALISHHSLHIGVSDSRSEAAADLDNAAYQFEIAVRAIRAWNLTDREDKDLPLEPDAARRASVAALPDVVFKAIVAAVATPTRDEAAQKSA